MPEARCSIPSSYTSSSALNATILAVSVVAGGWLRFRGLGASDITADEAPSWLAASFPTVREVLHQGVELNPGNLAVHDVTLHFWMLAFGDDVTSIRALSAFLGTLAIVLVFVAARELFADDNDRASPRFASDSTSIASLSAAIFALNVVAVRHSREGRMYELMLDATVIQLWFFLRAVRRGGFTNYAGTALFSILATGTSSVAALVFLAEGVGLFYELRPGAIRWRYSWNVTVSLLIAGTIIAVLTPWQLRIEKASYFGWITPGLLENYVHGLSGPALESPIVLVTLVLAGWGVIRGWHKYTEGVALALALMLVPPIATAIQLGSTMLLVATIYSWTPLFAHRWILTCIVPLCILVAVGIWELGSSTLRMAALVLVVVLAAVRIHSYDPNSGDQEWGVQWRAATDAVLPELKAGRPVNVVPGYGMYAVRYYSRNDQVDPALLTIDNRRAQVLILADTANSLLPQDVAMLRLRYPVQLARTRGVTVLATPLAMTQPPEVTPAAR